MVVPRELPQMQKVEPKGLGLGPKVGQVGIRSLCLGTRVNVPTAKPTRGHFGYKPTRSTLTP